MKINPLVLILSALCVLFGGVNALQFLGSQKAAALAEKNQAEAANLRAKGESLAREVESLKKEIQANRARTDASDDSVAILPNVPSVPEGRAKSRHMGIASMMEMMKTPEMKAMMRQQARGTVESLYADLFKQLNLAPQQKEAFVNLLLDQISAAMETGSAFFGGNVDKAGFARDAAAQKAAQEAKMRDLLGPENFAKYDDFAKQIGPRMLVGQFQQRLATGGTVLQESQSTKLIQLMQQEQVKGRQELASAALSSESIETQMQAQQAAYQRVVDRSSEFLAPDQSAALGKFFENQMVTGEMGLKMMQRMFEKKTVEAPPGP